MSKRVFSIFNSTTICKKQKVEETHTYVCPVCERSFKDSAFLNMHVSTHFSKPSSASGSQSRNQDTSSDDISILSEPPHHVYAPDAFNVMMSVKQTFSKSVNHIHFSLDLVDGKLVPGFQYAHHSQSAPCPDGALAWTAENIKLKKISTHDDCGPHFGDILLSNNVLTIATNIPSLAHSTGNTDSNTDMRKNISSMHLPLFKSMLQKAFRRGPMKCSESPGGDAGSSYTLQGLCLCAQLLEGHPQEALRRLPMILVEDGSVHVGLPIVVWLMIAMSKGYIPPVFLMACCLQVFVEGSESGVKDFYTEPRNIVAYHGSNRNQGDSCSGSGKDSFVDTPISGTKDVAASKSSAMNSADEKSSSDPVLGYSFYSLRHLPACRAVVGSLFLRAAYGGMGGDTNMLVQAAVLWTHRFMSSGEGSVGVGDGTREVSHPYLHSCVLREMEGNLWGRRLLVVSSFKQESETVTPDMRSPATKPSQVDVSTQSGLPEWTWAKALAETALDRHASELPCSIRSLFDFFPKIKNGGTNFWVSEGVDFHCDNQMVNSVLEALRRKNTGKHRELVKWCAEKDVPISDCVKRTLWHFRSSVNHRAVRMSWLSVSEQREYSLQKRETLRVKAEHARVWGAICPAVKEYCARRIHHLIHTHVTL